MCELHSASRSGYGDCGPARTTVGQRRTAARFRRRHDEPGFYWQRLQRQSEGVPGIRFSEHGGKRRVEEEELRCSEHHSQGNEDAAGLQPRDQEDFTKGTVKDSLSKFVCKKVQIEIIALDGRQRTDSVVEDQVDV